MNPTMKITDIDTANMSRIDRPGFEFLVHITMEPGGKTITHREIWVLADEDPNSLKTKISPARDGEIGCSVVKAYTLDELNGTLLRIRESAARGEHNIID